MTGLAHSCFQHTERGECHFFTFPPFEGKAAILYTKSASVEAFKDFLVWCLNLVFKNFEVPAFSAQKLLIPQLQELQTVCWQHLDSPN